MSVSSHLTPDPERRLRLIHGDVYDSLKWTDVKLGAITAFAMVQMAAIRLVAPEGVMSYLALLALCAVLPVGILGCSPFIETPRPILPLDQRGDKPRAGDSLVNEHDIAGYSQIDLTNFLDRYLGGGVTATPYHEDIVAKIVLGARMTMRKRRLFTCACVLTGLAQFCLFARLIQGTI
jgi:hypothetical protein